MGVGWTPPNTGGGGGGGTSDHGQLQGLTDADHPISAIIDLQSTLDGKAASSHTHSIANVTNLQTSLDAKLSNLELTVVTHASSGLTRSLDLSAGRVFRVTMDQNCTFSFTNPNQAPLSTGFTVILSGSFTPTWPGSVDWPGGIAPTYTSPSVYTFFSHDSGTTWYGTQAGAGFA